MAGCLPGMRNRALWFSLPFRGSSGRIRSYLERTTEIGHSEWAVSCGAKAELCGHAVVGWAGLEEA